MKALARDVYRLLRALVLCLWAVAREAVVGKPKRPSQDEIDEANYNNTLDWRMK